MRPLVLERSVRETDSGLGVSVDCPGCGHANREAAKFCAQCATPLPTACASCGAELSAAARFCDQCGMAVATPVGDTSGAPARKVVTVLFADLVGSTSFGERVDAESTRDAMAGYHAMAQQVIDDAGGRVAKFIGDGVMAVFGVPETAEDDAARAVGAGFALQRGFEPIRDRIGRRHGVELGLRVGVNTGEVVLAHGDADIVGDAINTAARLEAACTPGDVLVGEDTWRLTRSTLPYEALGAVLVPGKSDPIATFRALEDEEQADDTSTPFVGRTVELARLRTVFDDAVAQRTARLATVIGAPGVGKTRLARELGSAVAGHAEVVDLRCERFGTTAFAPVGDLLHAVADLGEQADPEAIGDVLRAIVGELDDADRVIDVLASFVGAAPVRSTEEAFLAVRRLVEAVARERPIVLVVDDIQWAEPLFLDLLEHLAEWVRDAPVAIVGLARPELRELRPSLAEEGRLLAATIALDGLDAAATTELAARLIGATSLPIELVARLPESTEGNPLFVRELMRMLVDDGVIVREGDEFELTIEADAVEVPPTIQSLLAARLDRMPAAERRLVELASVVGPEFALGAVASISEADPASLRSSLDRLRRRELVDPTGLYWGDEPIFRFHHVLIRDAAYRRLLKRTRADLHLRVGDWTERTAEALQGEHEVAIAYHYEQAHEYRRQLDDVDDTIESVGRRAAELFATAAQRALGRDDLTTAASLARRALDRVDDADPLVPAMLVVAAEASLSLGDIGAGREMVERLRGSIDGDRSLAAWSQAFTAQVTMLTEPERLHEADEQAEAAALAFAELGDEAGVAKARLVRAGALARLGQIGRCESELDLALTAARAAGDRRRVAAVLGAAPIAALWGPSPIPRAGGRCLDVIRLLRITTGSPAVEATSVRCQAVLEALRGRFDTARSMLTDARSTVEELGLRHALNETDLYTGIVELLAGDAEAAEAPLRRAHQGLGRLGIGADAGQAAAYLARALLQQGRLDEAEALADESAELAGENPQTAIAARTAQAEILAARGRPKEAVAIAAEAVALAEGTDIIVDHAQASAVLARVAGVAGDVVRADRAAAAARELYEQKAATVEVEQPVGPGRDGAIAQSERSNRADRLTRSFIELFTAGRRDEWFALLSPHHVTSDRRPLVGVDTAGAHQVADAYPRDQESGALTSTVETLAIRDDSFALVRWKATSAHGREWDSLHLTRWTDEGLNDLNVIFPTDRIDDALAELDRLHRGVAGDAHVPWNEADRLARLHDSGRAAITEFFPAFDPTTTVDVRTETIAVRGERLVLHHVQFEERGGTIAWDVLSLCRYDEDWLSDLRLSFEPDQLEEAVDELERLYLEELGDSFVAWQLRAFSYGGKRLSAGDVDGFLELHSSDFVMHDHRQIGWGTTSTADHRERLESISSLGVRVLVLNERFLALDVTTSVCVAQRLVFTMPDGVEQVARSVVVMIVDPHTGLLTSMEQFEEDQVDEALQRFDELMAERGPVLRNAASDRAAIVDRWRHYDDVDFVADLISPDVAIVDSDGEPFEPEPVARRQVLAVRGDHVALVLTSGPGRHFVVEHLGDDMRLDRIERFDNLAMAYARLEEFALQALSDDQLGVAHLARTFADAALGGDVAALAPLLAGDFASIDHRALGLGRSSASEYLDVARHASTVPGTLVDAERLRVTAMGIVSSGSMWTVDGDAVSEGLRAIRVLVFRDDLLWRLERFDFDDRDVALRRFDQLVAEMADSANSDAPFVSFGDRHRIVRVDDGSLRVEVTNGDGSIETMDFAADASAEAQRELTARWFGSLSTRQREVGLLGVALGQAWVAPSRHDFDRLLTPDFELVDGRTLGMGSLDRTGFERALRGRERDGAGGPPDPDRVAFASDDVMVFRAHNRGIAPATGIGWEEIACNVLVAGGDRILRLEMFDEDRWDEAMTRARAIADEGVELHHPLEEHTERNAAHLLADDFDEIRELTYEPDFVREDRRTGVSFPTVDLDGLRAAALSLAEQHGRPTIRRGPLLAVRPNAYLGSGATLYPGGQTNESLVVVVGGPTGRIQRLIVFDRDDRQAALEELDRASTRPRPARLRNDAVRQLERLTARWNARQHITDLLSADFVRQDRRPVIGMPDADRADFEAVGKAGWELGITWPSEFENVVAVRGHRFALVDSEVWYPDGGVLRYLTVMELDSEGLLRRVVLFEPEQLDAAFDELDELWLATLDPADAETYRIVTGQYEAYVALDRDRVEQLSADDLVFVDRRETLGNFGRLGRAGFLGLFETRRETLGPGLARINAVHRAAGGVVAMTKEEFTRSDVHGFVSTTTGIHVVRVERGRVDRGEIFDDTDLDVALDRANELIADRRRPRRLPLPEVVQWGQRVVDHTLAGDFDAVRDCFDPEFRRIDRRRVVGLPELDRDGYLQDLRGQSDLGWQSFRMVRPIAVRDTGFVAEFESDFDGGTLSPYLVVLHEGPSGRIGRLSIYDDDDLDTALDELDELWLATLDPADGEAYRLFTETYASYVALDRDRLEAVLAEDYVFVDHRRFGFGEVDRKGFLEVLEGRRDTRGPGTTMCLSVHRMGGGIGVLTATEKTALAADAETASGGDFVTSVVDGQVKRVEMFDQGDTERALTRADELVKSPHD